MARCRKNPYFKQIEKLHQRIHSSGKPRIRLRERRDAGTKREPASSSVGPETEAAFGRKREAAIADAVAASPSKRARMIRNAPQGLAGVAQEAAEDNAQQPAAASAKAVSNVAKRESAAKERNLRGAIAAAKARAKRELKVARTATQLRQGRDAILTPALSAGIVLVRLTDTEARKRAQKLGFQFTSDPIAFVTMVSKVPASAKKGHVVLAPLLDTDYSISAHITAALLGAFYATPEDFASAARPEDFAREFGEAPRGIMYTEKLKSPKDSFHVAVSEALATDFPTLPQLLRAIATVPGSCFKFYLPERQLCKFSKKPANKTPRMQQRICVLAKPADRKAAKKKNKELYINPRSFLLRHEASNSVICPGWHEPCQLG